MTNTKVGGGNMISLCAGEVLEYFWSIISVLDDSASRKMLRIARMSVDRRLSTGVQRLSWKKLRTNLVIVD